MSCVPGAGYVNEHTVAPLVSTWPPQLAIGEPPSSKVTVPVGVPEAGAAAVTVAVYKTLSPDSDGRTDESTVEAATPRFTAWVIAVDVEMRKLASPL